MSTIKRALCCVAVLGLGGALAAPAMGVDALIPGKQFAAQAKGKLKIQAKDAAVVIGTGDPTVSGATLKAFDEGGATNYTLDLPAGSWSGDAEKGFKFKGTSCKAKLKAGQLKAKCAVAAPTVPFVGDAGVVFTIDTDNYCMEFPVAGATKNDEKQVKIKGPVPAPGSCPSVASPCSCAAAGAYTFTNLSGGTLQVGGIGAPTGFPFPDGGTIVQDVGAPDADCVHDTVVPNPGGFTAPTFCLSPGGLNYTVQVTQSGCGIGKLDSDGGSDFTVTEVADTSDDGTICPGIDQSAMCTNGQDSGSRVSVTVGDGVADTCPTCGGNGIVSVPVSTLTWTTSDFSCPDPDETFDPGPDTQILLVDQILDFTTDVASVSWSDLDSDGCGKIVGSATPNLTRTGTCADFTGMTVSTAAAGSIGSVAGPLYDLSFATLLPNSISGPAAPLGATCATPPVINFAGSADRCTAP